MEGFTASLQAEAEEAENNNGPAPLIPKLPLDIIDLIAHHLSATSQLATCASLNATSHHVRATTLSALWKVQRITFDKSPDDLACHWSWPLMTRSTGFPNCQYLVVTLEPACHFSAELYARQLSAHLAGIEHRLRAVVVLKNRHAHCATASVVFSSSPRWNDTLVSDLADILDASAHLDVRFCLPDAISDAGSPSFDLSPCLANNPRQIQWLRISLHDLPSLITSHHLPASITTALGLLAASHELWTPSATQDPERFQADRKGHKTYRPTYRRPTGAGYLSPTLQVTSASVDAAGMCIQAFADALETCPNIATIALKLKLSHTTPTPTPEQLHALLAPLVEPYKRACENLSTRLVGGVEVQDSKKVVVAVLNGDGVVVVGEAAGKAAKERASG